MKCTLICIILSFCLLACGVINAKTATPLATTSALPTAAQVATQQPSPIQHEPTITDVPSPSPTPDTASCIPFGTWRTNALVRYVFDGDTIDVELNGKTHLVRYIGIDAPEDTRTIEFFGAEATQKNRQLVAGRTITLVKDISETDRYDRLLRYILVENTFINYLMVLEGYAYARTYPPDISCSQTLMQAERHAREHQLGLWGTSVTKSAQ